MVQRYTPQVGSGTSDRSTGFRSTRAGRSSRVSPCFLLGTSSYHGGYPYEQWYSHPATQSKPRWSETSCGEVGDFMLSVTGLNKFYFLKDFHDMRYKYERVLSIIHQQHRGT